jgi:hypothetical protein
MIRSRAKMLIGEKEGEVPRQRSISKVHIENPIASRKIAVHYDTVCRHEKSLLFVLIESLFASRSRDINRAASTPRNSERKQRYHAKMIIKHE